MCQKLPMIMNPCGGGGAGGLVALLIYGVRAGRIGRGEEPGPFGIKNPAATVDGAVLFRDPPATDDLAWVHGYDALAPATCPGRRARCSAAAG